MEGVKFPVVISYANGGVHKLNQDRLAIQCDSFGYRHREYGPDDIDDEFKNANEKILKCPRGGGYWLWKPYVINKHLSTMKDGEFMVYADAGTSFRRSLEPIIGWDKDITIYECYDYWVDNSMKAKTKWSTLVRMEAVGIAERKQLEANFVVFKNSSKVRAMVKRWLDACCDYMLISDEVDPEYPKNDPAFDDHRHDQSILSIVLYLSPEISMRTGTNCEKAKFVSQHRNREIKHLIARDPVRRTLDDTMCTLGYSGIIVWFALGFIVLAIAIVGLVLYGRHLKVKS